MPVKGGANLDKHIKNIYTKIKSYSVKKMFAVISVIAFLISLLPLLYMCRYVHASGDDYGYGAWTHSAWLDTHSLIDVLKAACETVKFYYKGWQGTWSSVFLFTLQPEVFSSNAYWIVPVIMIGLIILGTSLLAKYLIVNKLGFSKSFFYILNSSLLFTMIQFMPKTKSAFFWYNGTTHYIIPYFWALFSIYCFFKFIDTYKVRYWVVSFLCMFMLGGASYLSALLSPIILVSLLVIYGAKKKKIYFLLIPLVAEGVGLVISMAAPGNKVRGGSELSFSIGKVIGTILESFYEGIMTIRNYAIERPIVFIYLIILIILVWDTLLREGTHFQFTHPIVFTGFMFCTYCAMFAPGIYAGTEVSGGVPNTIFQVFLLTATAVIVYVLGWLFVYLSKKNAQKERQPFLLNKHTFRITCSLPMVILCVVLTILGKSFIRESTMFQFIDYVVSGQADDYKEQMEERLDILLDDNIKDVELPQINQEQGPLMHMEVLDDPNAWTNQVACQFFRKERIVGVERK